MSLAASRSAAPARATPIITGIFALAGNPKPNTYPAEYSYLRTGHLFDVTAGTNGPCPASRPYLCIAQPGFDGPTGFGTPNGIVGIRRRQQAAS